MLPEDSTHIVSIFFVKVTIMGLIAVRWIGTKVSEVTVASIFRVEAKRQQVSKYKMVKKSLYLCLMYNLDLYVHDMCHVVLPWHLMEAIPMCQLLTTETIKFQSNTSVLFITFHITGIHNSQKSCFTTMYNSQLFVISQEMVDNIKLRIISALQ